MSENVALLVSLTIYKIASLLAGTSFGYMGFRLFAAGIWGDAGTLQASYDKNKLMLKGAAPGTFFVVLGAIIIGVALFKGMNLTVNVPPAMTPPAIQKPAIP